MIVYTSKDAPDSQTSKRKWIHDTTCPYHLWTVHVDWHLRFWALRNFGRKISPHMSYWLGDENHCVPPVTVTNASIWWARCAMRRRGQNGTRYDTWPLLRGPYPFHEKPPMTELRWFHQIRSIGEDSNAPPFSAAPDIRVPSSQKSTRRKPQTPKIHILFSRCKNEAKRV